MAELSTPRTRPRRAASLALSFELPLPLPFSFSFVLALPLLLLFSSDAALGQIKSPDWSKSGAAKQFGLPALERADFNRLAFLAHQPIFWLEDKNKNRILDVDELTAQTGAKALTPFVQKGKLTPRFEKEYRALVELKRRESIARELNAGRPVMLRSDFSKSPAYERALLKELLAAGILIEDLYLRQTGGYRLKARMKKADPASQALFERNHGPWCQASPSIGDAFCSAMPDFVPRRTEAYPEDIDQDDAMCKALQKDPSAKQLLDPFTVVRKKGGKLEALSIHKAFGKEMTAVAARLKAAAKAVEKVESEKALHRYLLAAAKGFETNVWGEADEAWVSMNGTNSKWYVRIGPDEVYFDPCQQKAGFHLSLARIDQSSISWQKKLTPLRQEMEAAIAKLIGKPYVARQVKFHMPDFIQVVVNEGDSRHPLGGVIGQSLPNWGKVVEEGRSRTVVMTNLYTDPDSRQILKQQAAALLDAATLAYATDEPSLIDIILHEATHNFGPYSDYKVGDKPAKAVFGGALSSTCEELKAQTGALYYLGFLRKKGLLDDQQLKQAYTGSIIWGFGHIAQGLFDPEGRPRPYSQLAAIQIGSFIEDGAMTFRDGRFGIDFAKLPGSIEKLLAGIGKIKATGDVAGAKKLVNHFVTGYGARLVQVKHIARELARFPKASFLYAVIY